MRISSPPLVMRAAGRRPGHRLAQHQAHRPADHHIAAGFLVGTFTDRLADAAFRQLIVGADALIDVHAGEMVEALEPFALYDAGPAGARELASAYGLGYMIRQEPGPDRAVGGTTSAAAATLGIPAIIAEAGGCGLVEQAGSRRTCAGSPAYLRRSA
jgi:predicted deacylase